MDEVAEVCDLVLVLKNGSIVARDTPENLAASIAVTRIELIMSDGIEKAVEHLPQHELIYSQEKHSLVVEIEEQGISQLLSALAAIGVQYTQISIEKPTLEDYFIRISREK